MQTRRILLGALAAPVLLLPACGGHDSVADPPVSSAPTSSDPTDPPKQESPEHFIRRFAEVERDMENSGRVKAYKQLTRQCDACSELARQVQSFYKAGGYVKWAGWDVRTIRPYSSGQSHSYAVRVVSAPTRYRETRHGIVKRLPGGPATEVVSLRRSDQSWIVVGRARLKS